MLMTKEEREREIFKLFGTAAGLLPNGTFESRVPDEPDILYLPIAGESQAFELIEIMDEDYSMVLNRQLKMKDVCVKHLHSLPPTVRTEFEREFCNADIFIDFRPNLTMPRRRNALPRIFEELLDLPSGTTGQVFKDSQVLKPILEYASISRGRFHGPLFDTSSVARVGDPTVNAIKKKMTKSYTPQGELNLLAYIDGNPMYPEDIWLPVLDKYLDSLDSSCQFAHIYVFDCGSQEIHRLWNKTHSS